MADDGVGGVGGSPGWYPVSQLAIIPYVPKHPMGYLFRHPARLCDRAPPPAQHSKVPDATGLRSKDRRKEHVRIVYKSLLLMSDAL